MTLKRFASLAFHRAKRKQFYLELAAYFLRKGCKYEIGEVISSTPTSGGRVRKRYISNIIYDARKNHVHYQTEKKLFDK